MSNKGGNPPQATPKSKTQEVHEQVEEVKGIMHKNIESLVKNVENLEVLQDKTETMKESSLQFKKGATTLQRKMWWRNLKLKLIIALIIILIVGAIILAIVVPLVTK